MPRDTIEEKAQSKSMGKEKRKPVRRDPEKRRQQNIRAQRKYRECSLEYTQIDRGQILEEKY
jgi:hypothetical protein